MGGDRSPSGDVHPGTVRTVNEVRNTDTTRPAAELSPDSTWVDVGGVWRPVVRVVISGGDGIPRRISRYDEQGGLLETTVGPPSP